MFLSCQIFEFLMLGFCLQLTREWLTAEQFLQNYGICSNATERSTSTSTRSKWPNLPSRVVWSILCGMLMPRAILKRMLASNTTRNRCIRECTYSRQIESVMENDFLRLLLEIISLKKDSETGNFCITIHK